MKKLLALVLTVVMLGCTQAQVDTVLSDIDLVLQTASSLSSAVGSLSPADAAVLTNLTQTGIAGIDAVKAAYDTYEENKTASNLQNVLVAAQAIQTNLQQELAAAHFSDPAVVQKITAWVALVVDTAAFVVNTVQRIQGTPTAMLAQMPTPESLKAAWQVKVCLNDASCTNLVQVHHVHAPRAFQK